MKPNIHPDYHLINVKEIDGNIYQIHSTYGKEGATLHLDVDWRQHHAWTGGGMVQLNAKAGKAAKFGERYGNLFGLGGTTKPSSDESDTNNNSGSATSGSAEPVSEAKNAKPKKKK